MITCITKMINSTCNGSAKEAYLAYTQSIKLLWFNNWTETNIHEHYIWAIRRTGDSLNKPIMLGAMSCKHTHNVYLSELILD